MPEMSIRRRSRFLGLPSTALGWASVVLLVAFFVAAIVMQAQLGIDTRWVNIALLLSSGIAGLSALILKRDRSWMVWLPVVLAALVFGGEIVQVLVGGG